MERRNRNCSNSTTSIIPSSGENIQQRPNLEASSSENNKKEQMSTKMALYHFSNDSNNGECTRDANGNKGSNVANNPSCKSAEKDQSSANLTSSINNEIKIYYDIAPASFYENLIEQMDKSIIMLKKFLDRVLEMRELKLSLKEISSPELVCKAEELSTQLTALEESHSRFNEIVLSLKDKIRPSVNNDANRDRMRQNVI